MAALKDLAYIAIDDKKPYFHYKTVYSNICEKQPFGKVEPEKENQEAMLLQVNVDNDNSLECHFYTPF